MKAKYLFLAMGSMCSLLPGAAMAQVPCSLGCIAPIEGIGSVSNVWATKFYAGMQWNFGDSRPELVVGVRRSETHASSRVTGGKADLAVPLTTKVAEIKPVLRVMGLYGNRDVQAEFGLGVRAIDWQPLVGAGIQVPYANVGFNYVYRDGFKAYAGANTLTRAPAPRRVGGSLTCSDSLYELRPVANVPYIVEQSSIVNGYTCYEP